MRSGIIGILIISLLAGCRKNNHYQAAGTLTGPDYSLCACCGGVILVLDNTPGNFRIDSLPFMPVQQFYNLNFPKKIKFNYNKRDTCGGIERFTITEYFMQN